MSVKSIVTATATNAATTFTFKNPSLAVSATAIRKELEDGKMAMLQVAHEMQKVQSARTFSEDGFKNAAEFVQATFGIQKSSAYNLLSVGRFLDGADLSGKDGSILGYRQVLELSAYSKEIPKVKDFIAANGITDKTSTREIANLVKAAKAPAVAVDAESSETTPETATPITATTPATSSTRMDISHKFRLTYRETGNGSELTVKEDTKAVLLNELSKLMLTGKAYTLNLEPIA